MNDTICLVEFPLTFQIFRCCSVLLNFFGALCHYKYISHSETCENMQTEVCKHYNLGGILQRISCMKMIWLFVQRWICLVGSLFAHSVVSLKKSFRDDSAKYFPRN